MPEQTGLGLVVAAVAGFLLAGILANAYLFQPFKQVLHNPILVIVSIGVTIETTGALLLLARQSRQQEHSALIEAILGAQIFAIGMQALAPAVGWWAGTAVEAPIVVQAPLYGVSIGGFVGLFLLMYRWFATRSRRVAILIYMLLMIALIPITVFGDQYAISLGYLVFQNGYTISSDVLYGEVLLWFPMLLYEIRRWG